VARERMSSTTGDDFTDRVYSLDNRRIYKGIPEDPGPGHEPDAIE